MIDAKVEATIRELLDVAFLERDAPVRHEREMKLAQFSAAGALGSGRAVRVVIQIFEAELKVRAEVALNVAVDALRRLRVGLGNDAKGDLMALLGSVVAQQRDRLLAIAMEATPFKDGTGSHRPSSGLDPVSYLDDTQGVALRKIGATVDLLLLEAAAAARDVPIMGRPALAGSVSVTGHGNVVITGTVSRSPISVVVDASVKQSVAEGLDKLDEALAKGVVVEGVASGELQVMSRDARDEVSKPTPNKLRLRNTLEGIARTIQTTAALKPAYEAIKGALSFFGVTLP